jgi:hypothetical protein
MTFDERFDERTERQHCETSCAGLLEGKPDQPIGESTASEALVDLGMDERDQAGACVVGGEADDLAVDRQLVALTVGRVSHLDALFHGHVRKLRDSPPDPSTPEGLREVRALEEARVKDDVSAMAPEPPIVEALAEVAGRRVPVVWVRFDRDGKVTGLRLHPASP